MEPYRTTHHSLNQSDQEAPLGQQSHLHPLHHPQAYGHEDSQGAYLSGFDGRSAKRSFHTPDNVYVQMSIRIAILERDLEHCRSEKAEAELAVQYLAHLNASKASQTGGASGVDKVLGLEHQLSLARNENTQLHARLEEAKGTFLACLESVTRDKESGGTSGQVKDNGGSTSDLTLLDAEDGEVLEQGEHSVIDGDGNVDANASFSSSNSSESYIRRFTKEHSESPDHVRRLQFPIKVRQLILASLIITHSFKAPSQPAEALTPTQHSVTETHQAMESGEYSDLDGSSASASSGPNSISSSFHCDFPHHTAQRSRSTEPRVARGLALFNSINVDDDEARSAWAENMNKKSAAPKDPRGEVAVASANQPLLAVAGAPTSPLKSRTVAGIGLSRAEHKDMLAVHAKGAGSKDLKFPDFFRYGIQYVPDESELNVYRTIVIGGLPSKITIQEVLGKVRGGKVTDAQLLNTTSITQAKTAIITFAHEVCANSYVEFVKQHAITIKSVLPQTSLVPTPTWPMPVNVSKLLKQQNASRSFQVHGFPRDIDRATLLQDLCLPGLKINAVENVKLVRQGLVELHFTSVKQASLALPVFANFRKYRGCHTSWMEDPCAQPLETLLERKKRSPEPHTIDDESFSVSRLLGINTQP